MKTVTTILSAAFLAASCTLAMAQASGGAAGSDVNPDRLGKGADQNPTGPAANPAAGTKEATTPGEAAPAARAPTPSGMTTAPVSGTTKDSSNPAQAPTADKK